MNFSLEAMQNAEHVLSDEGWCWCLPRTEDVLPFGQIVVHRHFLDRHEIGDCQTCDRVTQ